MVYITTPAIFSCFLVFSAIPIPCLKILFFIVLEVVQLMHLHIMHIKTLDKSIQYACCVYGLSFVILISLVYYYDKNIVVHTLVKVFNDNPSLNPLSFIQSVCGLCYGEIIVAYNLIKNYAW